MFARRVTDRTRARLRRALRWLAPSAGAACAAAVVAGVVDGAGDGGAAAALGTGFVALLAVPLVLAACVLVRLVWAGWQPAVMRAALDEGERGAPRLAGWVVVVIASALVLAWTLFRATWWLAAATAWKPVTVGFALPIIAIGALGVLLALSRPAARAVGWVLARGDARWRRGGRSTLLAPRRVLAAGAVVAVAIGYALWRLFVAPRLGPLDTSAAWAPLAGALAAAIVHALPGRARAVAVVAAAGLALAALAAAVIAWRVAPARVLALWGDQPLAGAALERVFSLDRMRARVPLATFRPVARPGAAHPDIVLITIDTVRADRTPPYGGPADMPTLRDLGAHGSVFLHAYAPSNVTRRSIPAMITGLDPTRVRGRVVGWALRLDPRHVVLAERLRAGGYDTAGFMCCKGFWGEEARTGLARGLAHLVIDQRGAQLAAAARAWVDARARRPGPRPPLFLWLHLIEPHNWTTGGPTGSDDDRKKLYDRSLTQADAMVREVLAGFTSGPPISVITADHGEALGDHGAPYHSTDLYNSNIQVPLVIAGPGIPPARIDETVSLTDLTPTLLELAGFVAPVGLDGRSLHDLATGARPPRADAGEAFAAMIKDRSNPGGVTAIVRGAWKLIETAAGSELYEVRRDPGERVNLIAREPARAAELRLRLEAHRARAKLSPF